MQAYLAFVLESTGILDVREAELEEVGSGTVERGGGLDPSPACPAQRIVGFDPALHLATRLLMDSAPTSKLLAMLRPFLSGCLTVNQSFDRSPRRDLLQIRAAVAVVGVFLLRSSDPASLLSSEFGDVLVASVVEFCLQVLVVCDENGPWIDAIFRPIVALLSIERLELVPRIFREVLFVGDSYGLRAGAFSDKHSASPPSEVRLQALLYLTRSPELRVAVEPAADILLETVRSVSTVPTVPTSPLIVKDSPTTGESDATTKDFSSEGKAKGSSGPERIWKERLLAELGALVTAPKVGQRETRDLHLAGM
jgi:hypothetical protein